MTDILARLSAALADRYTIERELGAGGMATVYLAEDLKHHRKVAVKVLRPELAAILGPERFLKEIEVTANLQHPHVLPLYDSGEADSFLYYVMPHVEGDSLRDKLNRDRQLPVEETVEIAKSVAAAVDFAHQHSVIHRDIKPENILLQTGQPLVADFGIALAVSAAGGTRLTETGLSLGTPHYMSPEQASADRELDARSDVYSLGAVVYEMLVGEPPHVGNSAQAIVAKILSDTPAPVSRTRELVPANVEAAVTCALAKSPADRFTSAADFAEALTNPAFALPTASTEALGTTAPSDRKWQRIAVGSLIVAAFFAVAGLWGWLQESPQQVRSYGLAFPPGQEITNEWLAHSYFDMALDGSWIVYVGPGEPNGQLWLKHRDDYATSPISGTEGARGPTASPDGQWIAFTVDGVLRKIPTNGGVAFTLSDSANPGIEHRVAWLEDGTILFVDRNNSLRRVSAEGGSSEVAWRRDSTSIVNTVSPLPASRGVLFGKWDIAGGKGEVWALDFRTGDARMVLDGALYAVYSPSGHLVAGRASEFMLTGIFAAAFDLGSLEVVGPEIELFEDAIMSALSKDGLLLYEHIPGYAVREGEAVWVSRDGTALPVDPDWTFKLDAQLNHGWALSPDGMRVAIGIGSANGADIWIKPLDRGPAHQITFAETYDFRPRWTQDGRFVTYLSDGDEGNPPAVYRKRADGTGQAELLFAHETPIMSMSLGPKGEWLVARTYAPGEETWGMGLLGVRLGDEMTAEPLQLGDADQLAPAISPDGRWLAYVSNELGRAEVWVVPFPDVDSGKWLVSESGGLAPLWAHSGRELFFLTPRNQVIVAAVETEPSFAITDRQLLFQLGPDFAIDRFHTAYDISLDDQRFLMVRGATPPVRQLVVVENFFEVLKERVGND